MGERSVIARGNKTVSKTTYAIFFDGHGSQPQVPVPKGASVTGHFYEEQVLENVVKVYTERRPRFERGTIIFSMTTLRLLWPIIYKKST